MTLRLADAVRHGKFAAPHPVARVEGDAVAVVVAGVALLDPEARGDRRRRRDGKVRLAVERGARRAVLALEFAHEGVRKIEAVVGDAVRLLEALEPQARDPRNGALRRARQAQVLGKRPACPPRVGEKVVRPGRAPVALVAPVAVETRDDVRFRPGGDRPQFAVPQCGVSKIERGAVGALRVAPGTVRQRREAVVDRERVVAVVEIGVQQREVRAPAVLRFQPELEPRRRLVAAVRVVAPEESVLAEPVADRALEHGAPGALRGVAGRQCAAGGGARGPEAIATERHLGLQLAHRHGIARLDLDEAAERVRAVARALGSAQHLDLLDVEGRRDHADAAEVDLVDEEADRRIRRALVLLEFADAAELEIARPRACAGPGKRRQLRQEFLEVNHGRIPRRRRPRAR